MRFVPASVFAPPTNARSFLSYPMLGKCEDTGLMPEEIEELQKKIATCKENVEKMSPEMTEFTLYAFGRMAEDLVNAQSELEQVEAERAAAVEGTEKENRPD